MSNFEDKRRAEAQRVADQDHREQVEIEAANAIAGILLGHEAAWAQRSFDIMEAIRDGKIPHVKIEY